MSQCDYYDIIMCYDTNIRKNLDFYLRNIYPFESDPIFSSDLLIFYHMIIFIVIMMFFELFLLRKISEFPSGIQTHNLQIAGETF